MDKSRIVQLKSILFTFCMFWSLFGEEGGVKISELWKVSLPLTPWQSKVSHVLCGCGTRVVEVRVHQHWRPLDFAAVAAALRVIQTALLKLFLLFWQTGGHKNNGHCFNFKVDTCIMNQNIPWITSLVVHHLCSCSDTAIVHFEKLQFKLTSCSPFWHDAVYSNMMQSILTQLQCIFKNKNNLQFILYRPWSTVRLSYTTRQELIRDFTGPLPRVPVATDWIVPLSLTVSSTLYVEGSTDWLWTSLFSL